MLCQHEFAVKSSKLFSMVVSSNYTLHHLLRIKNLSNIHERIRKPLNCYSRIPSAMLHSSAILSVKDLQPTPKEIATRENSFKILKIKNKETFLKVLEAYNTADKVKRGHIEFIYAAVKYMTDFGVEGDLETYKKLMDVFPKGKMIPENLIQAEFFHFARHQECALVVLDQMDYNGVVPDREFGEIILQTFGKSSHVYKKYSRMLYWMPKMKHINPYVPFDPLPHDVRDLARLALKKMSVDRRTKIEEYDAEKLEDAVDKTWIMSAQSPVQQKLIQEHNEEKAIYVEGPSLVWLKKISITYFVLRADPISYPEIENDDDDVSNLCLRMFGDPKPMELICAPSSVHEQEDGIIMAMCCTGTSSKDSLLSWIRFLQNSNPKLNKIPVLFKLRTSPTTLVAVNANKDNDHDQNLDIKTQQ